MRDYYMRVVMTVDKRCAAIERTAASRVCSERNITCEKNTFAENFAISHKCMHERQFAAMSSLQYHFIIYIGFTDYAFCQFTENL